MKIIKNEIRHYLHDVIRLKVFVAVIVCNLVIISNAIGEEDPLSEYKDIRDSLYTSSALGGSAGARGASLGGPLAGTLVDSNSVVLSDKKAQEYGILGENGKSLKVKPGEKRSDFHAPGPKNNFQRFLDSKEWDNIYDYSIKNNAASMISATTWNLANSAVGDARFSAISNAQSAMTNHYLAELSFIKQVEQNPYMKQSISDAYFSCVRDKMSEGDKLSWFEAQEACMGDESNNEDKSKSGGGKEKVEPSLFDFDKSLDHKGSDGKKICLSDYLFNQESGDGGSPVSGIGTSGSDDGIKKLKESYQKLFGDIEFSMEDDSSVAGIRKVKYTFYYPGDKDGKCEMKSDKTPTELYLDVLEHRYKILVQAVGVYCDQVKRQHNGIEDYVKLSPYKELVEYYNVAGYQVTPQLIDNLYTIAVDTSDLAQDGEVKCNVFTDMLAELDLLEFGNENQEQKKKSRLFKSIFYGIAKRVSDITMIKLYDVFYTYLTYTTTSTFGAASNIYAVADKQINQIYKSVLRIDASQRYQFVMSNLSELAEMVNIVNALKNANSDGITDLKRDGNDIQTQNEDFVSPNK